MKLVIIINKNKFTGKLTKFFTGCYAYHVGWADEENNKFYDIHYNRRRLVLSEYLRNKTYMLHEFENVTSDFLEFKLETDQSVYGFLDYSLFALRPLYHIFGKSTRNAKGVICSEMINNDLTDCGYETPFSHKNGPPSPCDFVKWCNVLKGIV